MNLLITGGLGGIGWEIVLAIASESDVNVVTIGRSAVPAGCTLPVNVTHEVGSIQDRDFLERVMRSYEITHLIHAAGARTRDCDSDPRLAFEANVLGTDVVFRMARAVGIIERVLHSSSAAIYGQQRDLISEQHRLAPSSNYAISKAASELAVRGHTEGSSFQTVILRPAFVVGRPSAGKLTDFVRQAVTQPHAELLFPERFHVHWAADLAAAAIHLLRAPLEEKVTVFHVPGVDSDLSDLGAAVQRAAEVRDQSPKLTLTIDPTAPFPAKLDFSRFQQTGAALISTDLSTMIERIMDAARNTGGFTAR